MATPTYDLLDSVTLSSSSTLIEFTGLDTLASGYRDLVLVVSGFAPASQAYSFMRVNSDSGSNYNTVYASGRTGSVVSGTYATSYFRLFGDIKEFDVSAGGVSTLQFLDFSQTNKHKTVLFRYGNAGTSSYQGVGMAAGRWASTSAITSIQYNISGSLAAGSTAHLYGVVA